jgi:hypothetical protein
MVCTVLSYLLLPQASFLLLQSFSAIPRKVLVKQILLSHVLTSRQYISIILDIFV